jgi:hypothetical protein
MIKSAISMSSHCVWILRGVDDDCCSVVPTAHVSSRQHYYRSRRGGGAAARLLLSQQGGASGRPHTLYLAPSSSSSTAPTAMEHRGGITSGGTLRKMATSFESIGSCSLDVDITASESSGITTQAIILILLVCTI